MEKTDLSCSKSWEDVDIRTVDKNSLVDLSSVKIDDSLPVQARIESFIRQIKNPYCFRVGNVAVKVRYNENGSTFQQNFEDLLRSL